MILMQKLEDNILLWISHSQAVWLKHNYTNSWAGEQQDSCEIHLQLGEEKEGLTPTSAILTLLRLFSRFCPFNLQNKLCDDRTQF